MRMKKLKYIVPMIAIAFAAGCGDDDPTAPEVATEDLQVEANTNVVTAIAGTSFTFPNGGGAIAPALQGQNFSVTFSTGSTATFQFQGGAANAAVSFGSCIFTWTSVPAALQGVITVGQPTTVNPCRLRIGTNGTVTGTTGSKPATLTFGSATSSSSAVTVTVGSDGSVSIGNIPVGSVGTGASG